MKRVIDIGDASELGDDQGDDFDPRSDPPAPRMVPMYGIGYIPLSATPNVTMTTSPAASRGWGSALVVVAAGVGVAAVIDVFRAVQRRREGRRS